MQGPYDLTPFYLYSLIFATFILYSRHTEQVLVLDFSFIPKFSPMPYTLLDG